MRQLQAIIDTQEKKVSIWFLLGYQNWNFDMYFYVFRVSNNEWFIAFLVHSRSLFVLCFFTFGIFEGCFQTGIPNQSNVHISKTIEQCMSHLRYFGQLYIRHRGLVLLALYHLLLPLLNKVSIQFHSLGVSHSRPCISLGRNRLSPLSEASFSRGYDGKRVSREGAIDFLNSQQAPSQFPQPTKT